MNRAHPSSPSALGCLPVREAARCVGRNGRAALQLEGDHPEAPVEVLLLELSGLCEGTGEQASLFRTCERGTSHADWEPAERESEAQQEHHCSELADWLQRRPGSGSRRSGSARLKTTPSLGRPGSIGPRTHAQVALLRLRVETSESPARFRYAP